MYQSKIILKLLTSGGIEPRFATSVGLPSWQSERIGVVEAFQQDDGRTGLFRDVLPYLKCGKSGLVGGIFSDRPEDFLEEEALEGILLRVLGTRR